MTRLYVDLALVLDVSSLLFSCSRSVLSHYGISVLSSASKLMLNCSVKDGLHNLLEFAQLE